MKCGAIGQIWPHRLYSLAPPVNSAKSRISPPRKSYVASAMLDRRRARLTSVKFTRCSTSRRGPARLAESNCRASVHGPTTESPASASSTSSAAERDQAIQVHRSPNSDLRTDRQAATGKLMSKLRPSARTHQDAGAGPSCNFSNDQSHTRPHSDHTRHSRQHERPRSGRAGDVTRSITELPATAVQHQPTRTYLIVCALPRTSALLMALNVSWN